MQKLGHHYIAELWECPKDVLDSESLLREYSHAAAKTALVTVQGSQFFKFEPQGVTGILLLSESHLSFHTWPEFGYCAMDFFTCGDGDAALKGVLEMATLMGAGHVEIEALGRGVLGPRVVRERGSMLPLAMTRTRKIIYPPFEWTPELSELDDLPSDVNSEIKAAQLSNKKTK